MPNGLHFTAVVFSFILLFYRRLISGVTERISTWTLFTNDCYLKNLVRTPPGAYLPHGLGHKTAFGDRLWTLTEHISATEYNINNWKETCSLLGRSGNEMTAVHLVNSLHTITAVCEIWDFKSSDYHKINIIWNNAFRKIFQCCWRERVTCLLYYCKAMQLSYHM